MAFTRFHDDEARIIRQLQQQTDQERFDILVEPLKSSVKLKGSGPYTWIES